MEKARTFCRNNHGDLATIGDNNQRKFLWKYVRRKLIFLPYTSYMHPTAYVCEVQEDMLVA